MQAQKGTVNIFNIVYNVGLGGFHQSSIEVNQILLFVYLSVLKNGYHNSNQAITATYLSTIQIFCSENSFIWTSLDNGRKIELRLWNDGRRAFTTNELKQRIAYNLTCDLITTNNRFLTVFQLPPVLVNRIGSVLMNFYERARYKAVITIVKLTELLIEAKSMLTTFLLNLSDESPVAQW